MNVELLNTGSELLLGRILNTHQQWLGRRLADLGLVLARQTAVPDTAEAIEAAVREALARGGLVITTGGLGPTSDDVTRERIAALLGRPLREDARVRAHIADFFARRMRTMPASTAVQALVPEGARVLWNPHGTAPGLALEIAAGRFGPPPAWLVMLPGPPRELRPMFDDVVVPLLGEWLPVTQAWACRTLRSTGLGESLVEERVAPRLAELVARGLELGYCARNGEVDVRVAARGPDAPVLVTEAAAVVMDALHTHLYGEGDDLLEQATVRLLTECRRSVAIAESCTGGLIAHRLTNVPGASAAVWGGWVTYANEAKQRELGVPADLLALHGAVSEPVARAMAEGARTASGADFALAVTGIAGPTGGTAEKPVGTVFIALASAAGTAVRHFVNAYDRETFKQLTSQQALELLRQALLTGAPCGPAAGSGTASGACP
ncbi:MAG: competence/damage-inducible protein A [Limisphaerales bacterium]